MSKLRKDTLKALADWKAGKAVRSVELGHVHRMKENPGSSPLIDDSQHFHSDQERAHHYCFHILEFYREAEEVLPTFEQFQKDCDVLEELFRKENEGLTPEEVQGAESLAWKALLVGWTRAIASDSKTEHHYIEVTRPEELAIG